MIDECIGLKLPVECYEEGSTSDHANVALQVCSKPASFRPEKIPKVLLKLLRLVEPWEMTCAINEQQG